MLDNIAKLCMSEIKKFLCSLGSTRESQYIIQHMQRPRKKQIYRSFARPHSLR